MEKQYATPVPQVEMASFPVQVPKEAGPGAQMSIVAPNGVSLIITVPAGVEPGQTFPVAMPPGGAAPAAVVAQPVERAAPPRQAQPFDSSVGPNVWKKPLVTCECVCCFDLLTLGLCGGSCRYCDAVAASAVDPIKIGGDRQSRGPRESQRRTARPESPGAAISAGKITLTPRPHRGSSAGHVATDYPRGIRGGAATRPRTCPQCA